MARLTLLNGSLLSLILSSLLFGQPGSSTCDIVLKECEVDVWQDQYRCIMLLNSLQTLMNCVNLQTSAGETTGETGWCREKDNINDPGEDDVYYKKKIDGVQMLCIKPRVILLEGPQYREGGWWPASMRGVLEACPENDPDFLNCLCDNGVEPKHINQFAKNFKTDSKQSFNCQQYTKRATLPEEILALPSYNTTIPKTQLQARDESDETLDGYYVNDYGRPVYDDGRVGFPLPYYDQGGFRVRGQAAAKRCYIAPDEAYVATCRTWLIPTTTTLRLATQAPRFSNFTRVYTLSADATATAAPQVANVTSVAALPQVSAAATVPTSAATTIPTTVAPATSSTKPSRASTLMVTLKDSLTRLACFGILATYLIMF
ncbi:hypothetical protein VTL71DRAFT_11437 [Oculimacula yallundae]|uniref:Uncharacterized protein n=1 Tax=Oculimacula yallundae TaxID=86028 RepID=A0ABR4CSP2_9HELO